ncbi:hypothetical protein AXF42_Ash004434 [Apostasia shenzhenica]|uniref:Uncharacterized protein n=1 Tax=Apostasia shenzhenica TaxID=1088818 RepID=A0A2I0A2W3_9ASPA|nr:hypothetical protein AXF42_Ash004434 [Apostasia shenzhenica]
MLRQRFGVVAAGSLAHFLVANHSAVAGYVLLRSCSGSQCESSGNPPSTPLFSPLFASSFFFARILLAGFHSRRSPEYPASSILSRNKCKPCANRVLTAFFRVRGWPTVAALSDRALSPYGISAWPIAVSDALGGGHSPCDMSPTLCPTVPEAALLSSPVQLGRPLPGLRLARRAQLWLLGAHLLLNWPSLSLIPLPTFLSVGFGPARCFFSVVLGFVSALNCGLQPIVTTFLS